MTDESQVPYRQASDDRPSHPEEVYVGVEFVPYDVNRYNWNEAPDPADPTCRDCYAWRSYPKGQEHFGFTWWRICAHSCQCAHHENEVWIA